jgi:hypothetical protein
MSARPIDHLIPTATGLVSRAWVIKRVDAIDGVDDGTRRAWIDELCGYEAIRRHGMRNNAIFWTSAIGAGMLTDALGLPGWTGFVAVLVLFVALARVLATRTLLWRLDQLRAQVTPPA